MGFISNQWLEGAPKRVRRHEPVKAVVASSFAEDDWDRHHGIVLEIRAEKERSGDYHELLLTREEVDGIVSLTARTCSIETQLRLAADALNGLNDAQLVAFLSSVFRTRTDNSA